MQAPSADASPPPPGSSSLQHGQRDSDQPTALTPFCLHLVTLSSAGLALGYGVLSNLGTSELLRHGMPERHISLAFLSGPLAGLVIQPVVGLLCDRLRTRKPFILGGAVGVAASLRMFSHASSTRWAVAAICALYIALQFSQAALRAILTDEVPSAQRTSANSYLAIWGAIGQLTSGSLVASARTWKRLWFADEEFFTDAAAAIEVSSLLSLLCLLPCFFAASSSSPLLVGHRTDYQPVGMETESPDVEALKEHEVQPQMELKSLPRPFWHTFGVQLCTWCGFFAMGVYANAWVGTSVFGGDGTFPVRSPERSLFDAGVRFGSLAAACGAFVSLLTAVVLPRLSLRLRTVYMGSHLIEAFALSVPLYALLLDGMGRKVVAFAVIASFGVVSTVTSVVPWVIVAEAFQSDVKCAPHVGRFTTVFNISQSLPQLVLGLMAPMAQGKGRLVMPVAGAIAGIGAWLVAKLKVDTLSDERVIDLNSTRNDRTETLAMCADVGN